MGSESWYSELFCHFKMHFNHLTRQMAKLWKKKKGDRRKTQKDRLFSIVRFVGVGA